MIIGDLLHWDREKSAYAAPFRTAVDYLLQNDLLQLKPGRYDIQGDDMFALVQEVTTAVRAERKSEHHAKYIDLQYLISGDEEIFVVARQTGNNKPVEEALDTKDYILFNEVENEFEIILKPGMFAIFFPDDLHRPVISRNGGDAVKKVVIKINKALLQ
jgi:YhcH/YjgK/YiaL family protein